MRARDGVISNSPRCVSHSGDTVCYCEDTFSWCVGTLSPTGERYCLFWGRYYCLYNFGRHPEENSTLYYSSLSHRSCSFFAQKSCCCCCCCSINYREAAERRGLILRRHISNISFIILLYKEEWAIFAIFPSTSWSFVVVVEERERGLCCSKKEDCPPLLRGLDSRLQKKWVRIADEEEDEKEPHFSPSQGKWRFCQL